MGDWFGMSGDEEGRRHDRAYVVQGLAERQTNVGTSCQLTVWGGCRRWVCRGHGA